MTTEQTRPNWGEIPDPVETSPSPIKAAGGVATDGGKEVADAALPGTPSRADDQPGKLQREELAAHPTDAPSPMEDGVAIPRLGSRRHLAKAARMGNFQ